MNGLHFFFGVGAFLSPIIIDYAVSLSGDIIWAYWTLALFTLPVGLWLLRLSSPIAPATSIQDAATTKANAILVGFIAFFFFLYVGAESSFGGWIFTYAVNLNLTDETNARLLTSAFWGALTVGRLISIPIADRLRPRIILLADLLGCIISVGIILIWSDSLIAVWIGALGLGLAMASVFPITLSLAERRMNITGKITGWFFVGASTGGMTLPWLIGQFFESSGPRTMMLIILFTLLVAVGIYAAIIRASSQMAIIPTED
jgi:FHS family Na+ dependent glucose MFS transporter 1